MGTTRSLHLFVGAQLLFTSSVLIQIGLVVAIRFLPSKLAVSFALTTLQWLILSIATIGLVSRGVLPTLQSALLFYASTVLAFGGLYLVCAELDSTAFTFDRPLLSRDAEDDPTSFYFLSVTIQTLVGYGACAPSSIAARVIAGSQTVSGVLYSVGIISQSIQSLTESGETPIHVSAVVHQGQGTSKSLNETPDQGSSIQTHQGRRNQGGGQYGSTTVSVIESTFKRISSGKARVDASGRGFELNRAQPIATCSLPRNWARCAWDCSAGTTFEALPEHPLAVVIPLQLVQLVGMSLLGANHALQSGVWSLSIIIHWAVLQTLSTVWVVGLAVALLGGVSASAAISHGVDRGETLALLGDPDAHGSSAPCSTSSSVSPSSRAGGSYPQAERPRQSRKRAPWMPCCIAMQRRGLQALGVRFLLESGVAVAVLFGSLYAGLYLMSPGQPAFAMDAGHRRQPHPRLSPDTADRGSVDMLGSQSQLAVDIPTFARLVPELMAFSVTTLTGTGYGSVYPSGWYTRLAVGAQMLASILFVVVFLGLGFAAVSDQGQKVFSNPGDEITAHGTGSSSQRAIKETVPGRLL